MAIASPLSGLFKINKKFSSIFSSLDETKKTTIDMKKVALKKTKVKKEAIQGDKKSYQRKNEFLRRKEKEDMIEAKEIITKPIKVIGNAARGFLERLLDFIGALLLGWLTYNLPTILTMAREFIARIQRMVDLLKAFVGNIFNIVTGFGNVLGSIFQNVISFDFFDTSNRVKNSLDDLGNNFDEMGKQFEEGMRLLTTPLNEGLVTGQDAAPIGTSYETSPGGTSSSAGEWKPLLDLVASKESGGNYEALNPGTTLPGATKMTIAQVAVTAERVGRSKGGTGAVGRYQQLPWYLVDRAKKAGLDPNKDLFSPENQDLIAAKVNIGMNRGGNQWLAGKMKTETFMQGLSQEFAALPNASGQFAYPGQRSSITPSQVKKSLEQVKSGGNIATPSAAISTTVKDEINVSGPRGGTPTVGLTPGQGFGAARVGRIHEGIDIGTSNQRGYYVALKKSGKVVFAGVSGGYGNVVDIVGPDGTCYRFAHLAKMMVKQGASYNGQTIGEIGNTGSGSGIHLHFEVRPGGPYGRAIDPRPYLGLLSIGRQLTGVAGQPSAPPAAQPAAAPAAQPAAISPDSTPQALAPSAISAAPTQTSAAAQQLSTTKPGQQMVVIDDRKPPQMIPVGGGGGGQSQVIYVGQTLNSFIKNKLLLDLVYT